MTCDLGHATIKTLGISPCSFLVVYNDSVVVLLHHVACVCKCKWDFILCHNPGQVIKVGFLTNCNE